MTLRTLSATAAAALDAELMGPLSYTLPQLMELAGLSVAQAVHAFSPPARTPRVLVACGPGNNGGDGLVAARHLHHFGYRARVYYPKPGRAEVYAGLLRQLEGLGVPVVVVGGPGAWAGEVQGSDLIVDAVFGFSFKGEVREPFPEVLEAFARAGAEGRPVVAVDAPSGWDVEGGPRGEGPGKGYMPDALVSLTAPKPLVKWFWGTHYVGGRFLGKELADKYGIDVPEYKGSDQIVEVPMEGGRL